MTWKYPEIGRVARRRVLLRERKTELKYYLDDLFAGEVLQPAETKVFANIFRLRLLTVSCDRERERQQKIAHPLVKGGNKKP